MIAYFRSRLVAQKGLTLVEILVCSLISLIVLGGILSCFLTGRFATAGARHRTQAMNVARARIEFLKSRPYAELASMDEVTTETDVLLDQGYQGNPLPCTRRTTLTPDENGITIAVVVSWNERTAGTGSAAGTYELTTWVSSPGAPPGGGS